MTSNELKALRIAAVTIRNAGELARVEEAISPRAEGAPRDGRVLQAYYTLAERSLAEIREARYIVEAHSTTGQPFPALAVELADLLAEGAPEIIAHLTSPEADAWRADALAIVTATGRSIGSSDKAAQPATDTSTPEPFPYLHARKSADDLRVIFEDLAAEGYIADKDPATGDDMLAAFIDAFSPDKQGRIIWIKKHGERVSKKHLCAFLFACGNRLWEDWQEIARAVFGVSLDRHDKDRYYNEPPKNERERKEFRRIITILE